ALQDVEASLPFALLGLDSDNGGEFINHHVMSWLQKRGRPVFMTRSRPYKKDDNAHVEQKNWTHIRQCFGYERHDNPEVVEPINALVKGAYGQLLNYFHASLKLERKERKDGRVRRIYGAAQTPLTRVLASSEVSAQTKAHTNNKDKETRTTVPSGNSYFWHIESPSNHLPGNSHFWRTAFDITLDSIGAAMNRELNSQMELSFFVRHYMLE